MVKAKIVVDCEKPAIAAKKTTAAKAVSKQKVSAPPLEAPEEPVKKKAGPKLPKTLAECADLLYKTREERYKVQKVAAQMEALEKAIKERLINELPKGEAHGIMGRMAKVEIDTEVVPTIEDWTKFCAHLKKTGDFDLIQHRLSPTAVAERWENKKTIPGVGKFNVKKVSCTKR